MPSIKIDLPAVFTFSTEIPVRITDINYGGHAGNDALLSIIHEARVRFLGAKGYAELNMGGFGLIMSDVIISFKKEAHYGDVIKASVAAASFTKVGFELFYKFEKVEDGNSVLILTAKTGMICYNYEKKRVVSMPEEVKVRLGE
jgi:acyl-CoA thioester hydrolase